eukprot:TRINITY_DN1935_c1_g1_i1.p1 TRINITY_DN1935_c1_g1~~TRINITY_DN1935_c1_g1_i1.p1  ORF type:complete len:246 (-),score=26.47 TRINITY_DN1935_c1_g1_i1:106-843(-)
MKDLVSLSSLVGGPGTEKSTECFLRYFALQETGLNVLLVQTALPLALMIGTALTTRQPWLAWVAGTNCFLPRFCSHFAKHAVCFQLRPQEVAECPWLPPQNANAWFAMAIFSVAACLLVGPGSWVLLTKCGDKSSCHVQYLVRSYTSGLVDQQVHFWEAERLARKMLLFLVRTTIPVTLRPVKQMTLLMLIQALSATIYLFYKPFSSDRWNKLEICTLQTGFAIAGLTCYVLAAEYHWASAGIQI